MRRRPAPVLPLVAAVADPQVLLHLDRLRGMVLHHLKVLLGRGLLAPQQRGLNLKPFLQIVESRVFQSRVADEVVELVARLDNVEIEDVV